MEAGYFKISGNSFIYFLRQGHLISHLIDRVKFRIFPKLHIVPDFPTHLDIETASNCQMKCPMCYTTYLDSSKKGIMKCSIHRFDSSYKVVNLRPMKQMASIFLFVISYAWSNEPETDVMHMLVNYNGETIIGSIDACELV